MKEAVLENIVAFIQRRSCLWYAEHKRATLKKRLKERMTILQLPDISSYWQYLRSSETEESRLLDLITINETSFFRNPCQYDYLARWIIPEIETERGKTVIRSWGNEGKVPSARSIMKIRVLCAGCSTGEEPYSAAMTILDSLKYPNAWKIEIIAGDISDSCLKTAAEGFYENDRLKGLPQHFIKRYTVPNHSGTSVKDEVKGVIRFCRLNLDDVINGASIPGEMNSDGSFDVIFCRNVMIYFSTETQQQLVDAIFRLLTPGGYFFTGDVEPLHMYNHHFETVRESGCLIYRKAETLND